MIQFIQSGKFRNTLVTIRRFVNGIETPGDGFPIVEPISQPFGTFPQTSDQALMENTDSEFNARVNAFNAFLRSKYSYLTEGDFVNAASGIDPVLCVPGIGGGTGNIPITNQTEIIIFFDSSGSMNTTLNPLLEMRNTLLKTALLPFYNMNETLYEDKVKVISDPNERTLHMLNYRAESMGPSTLIMVFQDEANSAYTTSTTFSPRKIQYETDLAALRARIESLGPKIYRGILFQVTRTAGEGTQFKNLVQAIENGTGIYAGVYGLSDKNEIAFQYDVEPGQNSQYYMDLILLKMRELGYRI